MTDTPKLTTAEERQRWRNYYRQLKSEPRVDMILRLLDDIEERVRLDREGDVPAAFESACAEAADLRAKLAERERQAQLNRDMLAALKDKEIADLRAKLAATEDEASRLADKTLGLSENLWNLNERFKTTEAKLADAQQKHREDIYRWREQIGKSVNEGIGYDEMMDETDRCLDRIGRT